MLRYIKRWFLHNIGKRKTLTDLVRETEGMPTVFISGTQSILLVLPSERKMYLFHENTIKTLGSHRMLMYLYSLFVTKEEALKDIRDKCEEFLPEDLDGYQRAEGRLIKFAVFKEQ